MSTVAARACLAPRNGSRPPPLPSGSLKESIGQGHDRDIARQGRVDHENYRHPPDFVGRKRLYGSTEAFEFAHVGRRDRRRVGGDGTTTDGSVRVVARVVRDAYQLPRVHLHGPRRMEFPWQAIAQIGIELYQDRAMHIRPRIGGHYIRGLRPLVAGGATSEPAHDRRQCRQSENEISTANCLCHGSPTRLPRGCRPVRKAQVSPRGPTNAPS